MSEKVSIKTEAFENDYKQEHSNNDTNKLSYNTTKDEHFTNMGNVIKKDDLDLDNMEEFLPENLDESTIDKIKEEGVDEMDEFLPEDSPSIYSSSSLTWKSVEGTKAFAHDEVHHQYVTQQRLANTISEQISLPKLEIMEVHEDEQDSNGPNVDVNEEDSRDVSMVSNKKVGKNKKSDKRCEDKNAKKSDMSSSREHKCELCSSSYGEFYNLMQHMRYKHPLSVNAEYTCGICDQKFTTQRGLAKHSDMMHPEANSTQTRRKYKCELCDCSYAENKTLRAHIRHKHPLSIDSEYICEICHKRFTTQAGLYRHYNFMHPEARSPPMSSKHKCEICESSFMLVKDLRRHVRNKHPLSTDTEYICEICNKRFTTQTGLYRHYYCKHPETQKPPEHKCEICGSCYREFTALLKHI
ncbi:uncharacterized protein [Musca autumnalis]|uniref:uncharacterized protein n=1 Tax=Musca autumnalis TaxID=221902 RepID=UPI003CF42DDA